MCNLNEIYEAEKTVYQLLINLIEAENILMKVLTDLQKLKDRELTKVSSN